MVIHFILKQIQKLYQILYIIIIQKINIMMIKKSYVLFKMLVNHLKEVMHFKSSLNICQII